MCWLCVPYKFLYHYNGNDDDDDDYDYCYYYYGPTTKGVGGHHTVLQSVWPFVCPVRNCYHHWKWKDNQQYANRCALCSPAEAHHFININLSNHTYCNKFFANRNRSGHDVESGKYNQLMQLLSNCVNDCMTRNALTSHIKTSKYKQYCIHCQ